LHETLDFPLPPTTGSFPGAPETAPAVAPPALAPALPEPDELTALREKVAELEQVVALAKIRVETLGAEKREALERALQLEAQLKATQQPTFDEQTVVSELLNRVAALEAIVAPSRAA
jgi:hypothetical protein